MIRGDRRLCRRFGQAGAGEGLATDKQALAKVRPWWESIEEVVWQNSQRVLRAFSAHGLSAVELGGSTGYGYGDSGREKLEAIYAEVFGAESALVRPQWVSGTHALAQTLYALLLPGDELWVASEDVYNTLAKLLKDPEHPAGLRRRGVTVRFLPWGSWPEGRPAVVYIQRTRGYQARRSWGRDEIAPIIAEAHRRGARVVVDNCYGEFTANEEPTHWGADLVVGSLIKNPGGGLAPSGAYLAGRRQMVEAVADHFFAPGLGGEIGPTAGWLARAAQGLFLAPSLVGEALMGATYLRHRFQEQGWWVDPAPEEGLTEMVTAIRLEDPERVKRFCRTVQAHSPIDSRAVPEPWAMPGYAEPVIMAAGTFISGASLELSSDGPMAPPYWVYVQGGLSRWHVVAVTEACLEVLGSPGATRSALTPPPVRG